MEPCFGAGVFLDALTANGYTNVTACEIDSELFETAKSKYSQYQLYNADFLKFDASNRYDGIIMNPPYIRQEKIDNLGTYGITKERLRSNPIFSELPSTSNIYTYFIMKAIDLLKDGGELIVIFPSSWTNARTGKEFQKVMLSQCGLAKKVHIYGDIFEQEALVDVAILKLVKGAADMVSCEAFLEAKGGKLTPISANSKKTFQGFSYPFSKLASIKRGLGTGCNKMYINPDFVCEDAVWVRPILSSPKDIDGYSTQNARLDRLFFPIRQEMPGEVRAYLDFWKNKIVAEQAPKTLCQKIMRNGNWYELREICGEGILFSYFVRNDMKFVMNEAGVLARDNFYVITPKVDKWVLFALLNNYYTYFQLELSGKKYGAGLLKLQRYDVEGLTFPEYEILSEDDKTRLRKLSHKMLESGEPAVIEEITKLVANYSSVGYEDIRERYYSVKSSRLEVH